MKHGVKYFRIYNPDTEEFLLEIDEESKSCRWSYCETGDYCGGCYDCIYDQALFYGMMIVEGIKNEIS